MCRPTRLTRPSLSTTDVSWFSWLADAGRICVFRGFRYDPKAAPYPPNRYQPYDRPGFAACVRSMPLCLSSDRSS